MSISPTADSGGRPPPTMTANVGSTSWSTPRLFSVVYCSSASGSSAPAPTPTA